MAGSRLLKQRQL